MEKPYRVCVLLKQDGTVLRSIPPQYNLDKLYELAAEYACSVPIPTAFAHQAIFKELEREGYSVRWYSLVPESE